MREGVDTAIMTLQVDTKILPPRRRKKKVVWKLPDDLSVAPKFGMEDKRRILDVFKQRKKELKRQRKSQPGAPHDGGGDGNTKLLQRMSLSTTSDDSSGVKDDLQRNKENKNGAAPPPPGFAMSRRSASDTVAYTSKQPSAASLPAFLPRTTGAEKPEEHNVHSNGHTADQSKSPLNSAPASPSLSPPLAPPLAPPGAPLSSNMGQPPLPMPAQPSRVSPMPGAPQSSNLVQPPLPSAARPTRTSSLPSQPPGMMAQSDPPPGMSPRQQSPSVISPDQPPGFNSPPSRHFLVPENSTLAHVVTETYHLMLRQGLVQELSQYYTPTAQKSLTVGGAHALCTHVEQRILQLQSLSGMVISIKGVLQQPTVHGAILVLITGTCVQPHALPFCHSVVLVQLPAGGFQIQNDALCFLTSEG